MERLHFNLRTRMAVGFAILMTVLGLDLVGKFVSSGRVNDAVQAAGQQHLPRYVEMTSLRTRFVTLVGDFEETLFVGEATSLEECGAAAAAIEEGLLAQSQVGDPASRRVIAGLHDNFHLYVGAVVSLVQHLLAEDRSEQTHHDIDRLSLAALNHRDAVEAGFKRAVTLRREEFDAALGAAETAVSRQARVGLGLSAVLIALWLYSLYEIGRRVVGPITKLSRFATQVAHGHLDSELPGSYQRHDEVGRLWTNFGAMMRELRTTTVSREHVTGILNSMPEALILLDETARIRDYNPAASGLLGYDGQLPEGLTLASVWPEADSRLRGMDRGRKEAINPIRTTWTNASGDEIPVSVSVSTVEGSSGGTLLVAQDMREQIRADEERLQMERQLQQSSKLEAVGQLAAGIAHEINTPMQFIGDNTRFLQDGLTDLKRLIESHENLVEMVRDDENHAGPVTTIDSTRKEIDYDFLVEEADSAVSQSLAGVERVTEIVRAMKEFSHPGTKDKRPADLNRMIRNAATVSRTEWKYAADLDLDLDESLPTVPCLSGPMSQTILNLIVNAAHAIAQSAGEESATKGNIVVKTRHDGDDVEIRVSDDGCGMPEEIRRKVFEPFFTTKAVGKGTGQGLSIAHDTVVRKHGGTIDIDSEVGRGTTFVLRLPVVDAAALQEVSA